MSINTLKFAFLSALSTISSYIILWLGGADKILKVLVMFLVIDYVTGIIKAIKNKELSSYKGWKGVSRKICTLIVVVVATAIDSVISQDGPILRTITIMFYIGNEGLSIIENLAVLEVPIPEVIKKRLLNMKDGDKDDD